MFMRSPVMLTPSGDSTPTAPKAMVGFVFPQVGTMRRYRLKYIFANDSRTNSRGICYRCAGAEKCFYF